MNERTYLGARPTLLDVAKDAVEKFLKVIKILLILSSVSDLVLSSVFRSTRFANETKRPEEIGTCC